MKHTKNIILITSLTLILIMSIGYSTFATQLTLNGSAEILSTWNIRIIRVEPQLVSEGCDPGTPQYTDTSVTFDAKLVKPGDSITYVITIENAGTLNATLNNLIFIEETTGSDAIKYETSNFDPFLERGEKNAFSVKVEYDPKYSEVPSVKQKN